MVFQSLQKIKISRRPKWKLAVLHLHTCKHNDDWNIDGSSLADITDDQSK